MPKSISIHTFRTDKGVSTMIIATAEIESLEIRFKQDSKAPVIKYPKRRKAGRGMPTQEEKDICVELFKQGYSLREIARQRNVGKSSVHQWCKKSLIPESIASRVHPDRPIQEFVPKNGTAGNVNASYGKQEMEFSGRFKLTLDPK